MSRVENKLNFQIHYTPIVTKICLLRYTWIKLNHKIVFCRVFQSANLVAKALDCFPQQIFLQRTDLLFLSETKTRLIQSFASQCEVEKNTTAPACDVEGKKRIVNTREILWSAFFHITQCRAENEHEHTRWAWDWTFGFGTEYWNKFLFILVGLTSGFFEFSGIFVCLFRFVGELLRGLE